MLDNFDKRGEPVGLFHAIARFVRLLLGVAIILLFLRALFWPTALDLFVLLILFIVFATMFVGPP
jgi:hypothetical protein